METLWWLLAVVLGLLTAISFVIDLAATAAGAKRVGATRLAVVGAALGTLGGLFLGLPGLVLGPFVGTLAKLALVFTMLGVFAVGYFF
jgi:uncharacterized protein YqgC (DUF456 family)